MGADAGGGGGDEGGGESGAEGGGGGAGIGAPDGVLFEGGDAVGGQAGEVHASGIGVEEEGDLAEGGVVDDDEVGGEEIGLGGRDDDGGGLAGVEGGGLGAEGIVVGLADVAAEKKDDAETLVGELGEVLAGEEAKEVFGEVERVFLKREVGNGLHRIGRDINGREYEAADGLGEGEAEAVGF